MTKLNQLSGSNNVGANSRRLRTLLAGTALSCSIFAAPAAAQVIDQTSAGDVEIVTPSATSIRGQSTGGNVSITAPTVQDSATTGSTVYAQTETGNASVDLGSITTDASAIEVRTNGGDIVIDVDTVNAGQRGIFTRTLFANPEQGFTTGSTTIRAGSVTAAAGNGIVAQGYAVTLDADYVSGSAIPTYASTVYVSAGKGGADVDVGETVAHGYGQWGLNVYSDGDARVVSESVTTDGEYGRGLYVVVTGNADIESGTVSTSGEESFGIYVEGYQAEPASIILDSGTVTTTGNNSTAIFAPVFGAGPVTITSDAITTSGTNSHGIVVAANPNPTYEYRPVSETAGTGALSIVSGSIKASGPNGRGIIIDHRGPISVESEAVESTGSGIYIWANDTVDITSGSVTTNAGPGIVVYGGAGDVTVGSGTVLIGEQGDAGIYVETSSGDINITAANTTTTSVPVLYGFYADAVSGISQTGNVTIISGTASVAGDYASGIAARGATVSVTSERVISSADFSGNISATAVGEGGTVTVDSGAIEMTGNGGGGIDAVSQKGKAIVRSGTITATSNEAYGILARGQAGVDVLADDINVGREGIIVLSGGAATVTATGDITSRDLYGISIREAGIATVAVQADSTVTGGQIGIFAGGGTLHLTNDGAIRGNGTLDSLDAPPSAGVTLAMGDNRIVNNGTISGAGFGISTAYYLNPETNALEPLATGTEITNNGTIRGDANDAIRLIGGGSVTNNGTIAGVAGELTDGISMFELNGQDTSGAAIVGTVSNNAGATISGSRLGVIISGGAEVTNAGTITGGVAAALIQTQTATQTGKTATVTNTGTMRGGDSVRIWGNLDSATVANSGFIEGTAGYGIDQASAADMTIENAANGRIVGAGSGIALRFGSTQIVNDGTIRGDGRLTPAGQARGGVIIEYGENAIENRGTISGAEYGIVTTSSYDSATQTTSWNVINTDIVNRGTIAGENNDAILIFGKGSVVNSGTIQALAGSASDGIQLQYYPGQDNGEEQIGGIVNQSDGTISGVRYGILLAGGGTIENAGTITGGTTGVVLSNQNFAGKTGSLLNSGTINGGVLINLAEATAQNSGTINGDFVSQGAIELTNSGTITGGVTLSALDDVMVLQTGSSITGAISGGEGMDILALAGANGALTAQQAVSAVFGFEELLVSSGYWLANTAGAASLFEKVTIAQGATLDVREVSVGGGATSAIVTENVVNNGLLILNFNSDDLADIDYLAISGTGGVTLAGEANFVADQNSLTFTGLTTIANGSLTLMGDARLTGDLTTTGDGTFVLGEGGSFEGDLVNNGRFIFAQAGDYDFLGDFSGTGSFVKRGDGTLTFMGDYSYTGTTLIEGGTVRFTGAIDPETEVVLKDGGTFDISGTPQTIAELSGTGGSIVVDDSELTVNQSVNTAFGGDIAGDGALIKSGSGRLNLTGNSTYTGPTVVNEGAIAVNGSIVSTVRVNEGGTLMGSGTIGGAVITGNGTLAPGNSIGTLNVAGDISFAVGSIFEVEVNADGRSDQILATGQALIDGGIVSVIAEAGTFRPFTEYLIIRADGGVDGEFDEVRSDSAFLTPTLTYSANEVRLELRRNNINFEDVAQTTNQENVAAAIEGLGITNDLYADISLLTEASARQAFDALSGEAYASLGSNLIVDGHQVVDAVLDAGRDMGGTGVWARALGDWGSFDSANGVAGVDGDQQGVIGGVNFGAGGFTVGAAIGATRSDYRYGSRSSNAEVDTKMAALHAGYGAGPVTARIGGSYSWHDIEASRTIAFPGFSETASSTYDAKTTQLFGEVGYAMPMGAMTFEPFARVEHVRMKTDGFTETGDSAALLVEEDVRKVNFASLGLRATGSIPASATMTVEPSMSAAWRHGWGDLAGRSTAAFEDSDSFGITGARLPKNALDLDVGVALRAGNVRVGVSYRGMLSNQWNSDGGQVSLGVAF
ncbi:autotransporter domain-containing protein [Allosphingosinicella vermicomposti]|uniref:autotransporter domain-containing protein n=1 Tax=Allosphingosinicella vermicomposti TaxID=614671 RepID=UPI000D0F37E1|nr:autotransporter domain-containing protein [Allosphingosinicella vermicomposti]